jgi:hypothetical protein
MFDSLENIYFIFKGLNKNEKIEYLEELKNKNLGFKINWDNLILYWKNN